MTCIIGSNTVSDSIQMTPIKCSVTTDKLGLKSKVAFDVVFDMTMSRNLGFLKAGGDVDGILKQLQKDLDYRGIVSPRVLLPELCSAKSTSSCHWCRANAETGLGHADNRSSLQTWAVCQAF